MQYSQGSVLDIWKSEKESEGVDHRIGQREGRWGKRQKRRFTFGSKCQRLKYSKRRCSWELGLLRAGFLEFSFFFLS